jgi:hypothetical protein
MIADRDAFRATEARGTTAGTKRGYVKVASKISNETFGEIKALAMVGRRSISGQIAALIKQALEAKV